MSFPRRLRFNLNPSFSSWVSRGSTAQPITCLSKPQVKRLGRWLGSAAQAVLVTILLWPWWELRGSRATRFIAPPARSNILTFLLSYGTATRPPLLTEILLTLESHCTVATALRMFRRSHTFTVLSSEPDTMRSEFWTKRAEDTRSWWPWNTETACMVSLKSHRRKVESADEVTTRRWQLGQGTA